MRTALQEAEATAKREFQNFIQAVDIEVLLDCLSTSAKVDYQGYEFSHSQIRTDVDPTF